MTEQHLPLDRPLEKSGQRRLWVVTGLSGAGKSTALRAFEDLQYFTVDGLPASLAHDAAAMLQRPQMRHFPGMAIGMDTRQDNFVSEFQAALRQLAEFDFKIRIIFLESEDSAIIRRYAATRRPHPLERKGYGLEAAINTERSMLEPLRDMADIVVDSTAFSIHDLRRRIQAQALNLDSQIHSLKINLISFGFKYGIPHDADYIFDLRFLANPYFVEKLRPLSGMDKEVSEFIFNMPSAAAFVKKFMDLMLFTLTELEKEGRYRTTIALGCTGGRHRSVALTEKIAHALRQADYNVMLEHRNLDLDAKTAS